MQARACTAHAGIKQPQMYSHANAQTGASSHEDMSSHEYMSRHEDMSSHEDMSMAEECRVTLVSRPCGLERVGGGVGVGTPWVANHADAKGPYGVASGRV